MLTQNTCWKCVCAYHNTYQTAHTHIDAFACAAISGKEWSILYWSEGNNTTYSWICLTKHIMLLCQSDRDPFVLFYKYFRYTSAFQKIAPSLQVPPLWEVLYIFSTSEDKNFNFSDRWLSQRNKYTLIPTLRYIMRTMFLCSSTTNSLFVNQISAKYWTASFSGQLMLLFI